MEHRQDVAELAEQPRELTDEEWCALCFLMVDLEVARARLSAAILAEERPTLDQLWFAIKDYRRVSDGVSEYVSTVLRAKLRPERRAA